MSKIKTRESVKDIKAIDKAAVVSQRMKKHKSPASNAIGV